MAKGKGFGGFGGGMNMQAMMKQAQKMQESMLKAQDVYKRQGIHCMVREKETVFYEL